MAKYETEIAMEKDGSYKPPIAVSDARKKQLKQYYEDPENPRDYTRKYVDKEFAEITKGAYTGKFSCKEK